MTSQHSQVTTDHKKIKDWVEERGGQPARVKGTGNEQDPGLLRIDFPGAAEASIEPISWEEFFEKFEKEQLAFLYQDETNEGNISRFNKLIQRQ